MLTVFIFMNLLITTFLTLMFGAQDVSGRLARRNGRESRVP